MKVIGIILAVGLVALCIYQVYGLVKDIIQRKKGNKTSDTEQTVDDVKEIKNDN